MLVKLSDISLIGEKKVIISGRKMILAATIIPLLLGFLVSPATIGVASAASTNTSTSELSKQLFAKYEQLSWHYVYQESDKQNLESFEIWWCQDSNDDSCILTKNADFVFMMRYFEQHRDAVIWNLSQSIPQVQILPKYIKYFVSRDYADATNIEETFTTPWKFFVTWNQLTFHLDFSKTEMQNLQAFQKWLCEGSSGSQAEAACHLTSDQLASMMWFYEQHRDSILTSKVMKHLDRPVDKLQIADWISMDYQCVIKNNRGACI
jgi:hypothetical protein